MASTKLVTLITGSSQGIGYELAKHLLRSSQPVYHVLVSGRNEAKLSSAVTSLMALPDISGTAEPLTLDVTEPASISAAAQAVSANHGRVDVLVLNAGVFRKAAGLARHEAFREVLHTNTVAPMVVTEGFLELLRRQPPDTAGSVTKRLVFVSSSVGSLTRAADPESPYHVPSATEYRASKAALNFVMLQYHSQLKREGILVSAADPGLVVTGFNGDPDELRKRGGVEPEVGGDRVAKVVTGQRDADVGKVCGPDGVVIPW